MTRPEDADDWFVNLETLADRVDANSRRFRKGQRRTNVLAAFVLFAFILLAWRSEINADRISRNSAEITTESARISQTQDATCTSSQVILAKFNTLQDELSEIEREARAKRLPDDELRERRIAAYEKARILPLPQCRGGVAR